MLKQSVYIGAFVCILMYVEFSCIVIRLRKFCMVFFLFLLHMH